MDFTSKRVTATVPQGGESNTHQSVEDTASMGVAQPRSVEMTRQELDESEVGRYQVMNLLLTLGDRAFVSRSKLLFNIKWVEVAGLSVSKLMVRINEIEKLT